MTQTFGVLGFHDIAERILSMTITTMGELKSGMCRWPFGNPEDKDFHFCGDPSDPALPYCEEHMLKAHAAARKKTT